ncbi:MAG: hypothetical protein Fur0035_24580 [Anaerolineales bacterium]
MKTIFHKFTLLALLAALLLTALPLTAAFAAGQNEPPAPPAATPAPSLDPAQAAERLQKAFAREQKIVERLGHADEFLARIEKLVEKASQNGKDVSAIQAALTDLKAAMQSAQPNLDQAAQILATGSGFDASGKVTNLDSARETVRSAGEALKAYRAAVKDEFQALRAAIQAFREANPRPTRTPQP